MPRWSKLGIIAGAGALPIRLSKSCAATGEPFFVVRLDGMADPFLHEYPGADCGIAEVGKIIRTLKNENCDAVVLAGVVRRPDFAKLKPDWRGAALLPQVISAAARGDGALLSVLVETLEAEGLRVVGAEEVTDDLLAPAGPLGQVAPSGLNFEDIRKGAAVITALGPFDIGQGAVVASGLVLAIEAAEGTDAMLERCSTLPASDRGGDRRNGVLVKRPKPGQELRVDLPTIGAETLVRLEAASLAGVAVEAGAALIVDQALVRRKADELGLFVYGFTDDDLRRR